MVSKPFVELSIEWKLVLTLCVRIRGKIRGIAQFIDFFSIRSLFSNGVLRLIEEQQQK